MPGVRQGFREHRVASGCLAVLFVLATTLAVRSEWDRIDEVLHGDQYVGDDFNQNPGTFLVDHVGPVSSQAGLRIGDLIISVNGHTVHGISDIAVPETNARKGDRLLLRVRRAGAPGPMEQDISLPLVPHQPESAGDIAEALILVFRTLFCLALGFWIVAIRPGDRAAWALLFLLLTLGNSFTEGRTIYGRGDELQTLLTGFQGMVFRLGPIALFYFGLVFPERMDFDRRHPWIKWIVLGPMLVRAAIAAMASGLIRYHHEMAAPLWRIEQAPVGPNIELALIALFFVILVYRTVSAAPRDARRRFLLLDTGAAAGLVPLVGVVIWSDVNHHDIGAWVLFAVIGTLLIFPATMAYVIVVHRAMDVRVVLRQGLQYLLATSGVRILQIAISVGIIVLAATMSANASVMARVGLIGGGFALLVGLGAFADKLRCWLDRRFFREAYEADEILSDLAANVRTMVEIGPLLETVANRVAAALHVPRVAILLDGNGAFRPAYALGYGAAPSGTFSDESLTLRRLRRTSHTLVPFEDADSWVQLTDREERAALEELKPELLLPLSLKEKVLGIMSLGPKQSEEPFSPTDLRLLNSVAAQTGLALENGRLTETIKTEARAREKQNRELELGREVQERLFPQEYPMIPGLDYAGACRSALGVGGDYYDFIPMPNGGLGIAIGDVSGKGIPAALLMATLRAFLRGQAIDPATDLGQVIRNLNRLVFESSAQNRYATFFLATFDPASRVLQYVNAGHNAPMVMRAGGEMVRLEAGGSVVGLMRAGEWRQAEVKLEAGDLFIGFTDGISEAMNDADDEWGEERMIGVVRAMRTAPAKAILEHIVRSADAFVAGAPQYDDMTLIVARLS